MSKIMRIVVMFDLPTQTKEQKDSYIKFRSLTIYELYLTYFLKRKNVQDAGKIKILQKEEMCNKLDEFKNIKKYARGRLYSKRKTN